MKKRTILVLYSLVLAVGCTPIPMFLNLKVGDHMLQGGAWQYALMFAALAVGFYFIEPVRRKNPYLGGQTSLTDGAALKKGVGHKDKKVVTGKYITYMLWMPLLITAILALPVGRDGEQYFGGNYWIPAVIFLFYCICGYFIAWLGLMLDRYYTTSEFSIDEA